MEKLEFESWYGLWGPKNMPADLIARIHDKTAEVLKDPEVQKRLSTLGFAAKSSTPEEFAKFIDKEMATYSQIIKDANIKTE